MLRFAIRVGKRFSAHNMMVASAGVAFYGLLALAPTMIALGSIYGLFTCDTNQIEQQLDDFFPASASGARDTVEALLRDASGATENGCKAADGTSLSRVTSFVLGLLLAFWSASGAVQKLVFTITAAYEAKERRAGWRVRLLALGFTVALIVVAAALLLALTVLPLIMDLLQISGTGQSIIRVGKYPTLTAMYYFGLSAMYRYGPDREVKTPWWNWGAITGTTISILSAAGLTLYTSVVGRLPASYGLIGGVAVLMISLQLVAISALVGAEVNAEAEGVEVPDLDGANVEGVPPIDAVGQPAPLSFVKAAAGLAVLVLLGNRVGNQ